MEPTAAIRRSRLALLWGAAAVAAILLAPVVPSLAAWSPACPFRLLTGLPCPGCGMTRAAVGLAALDPLATWLRYPLPTTVWLLFLGGGLFAGTASLFRLRIGRRLAAALSRDWPPAWRWAIVGAIVANWIYAIRTGV